MAFFNRKLYRQKPKQWGPVSQVQANIVRKSALLGLPVPALYIPAWESGGRTVQSYDKYLRNLSISGNTIGYENNYLTSDGSNTSVVSIGNIASDDPLSGVLSKAITVIFRCKATANSAYARIIDKSNGASGVNGWLVWWRTGGTWDFYVDGIRVQLGSLTNPINKWTTVACAVRSGEQYHRLENSVQTGETACTFSATTTPARLLALSDTARQWSGLLDYIIVFDSFLSPGQIDQFYNQPYYLLYRTPPVFYSVASGAVTTLSPTTLEPTTLAPTTIAPTSLAPTTISPTTIAPTTVAPTTLAPTTVAPTSLAPTTLSPTTLAPTTLAPTTSAPTTTAPTTLAPTTLAPTTVSPTTVAPTTLSPTTIAPTTLAPTSLAPTTLEPTTLAPTTLGPTTTAPTSLAPTTIEPTTLAPTTIAPTTLSPTTLAPTTLPPLPPPTALRRGERNFGFSFRDSWR